MGRPYTSGIWIAKMGREDDFVSRWGALANWAAAEFPDAGQPTLLRDSTDRQRFVSFGAWPDLRQVEAFRAHPEFSRHVGLLREVLDDFTPTTLEAVIEPT